MYMMLSMYRSPALPVKRPWDCADRWWESVVPRITREVERHDAAAGQHWLVIRELCVLRRCPRSDTRRSAGSRVGHVEVSDGDDVRQVLVKAEHEVVVKGSVVVLAFVKLESRPSVAHVAIVDRVKNALRYVGADLEIIPAWEHSYGCNGVLRQCCIGVGSRESAQCHDAVRADVDSCCGRAVDRQGHRNINSIDSVVEQVGVIGGAACNYSRSAESDSWAARNR